jgi:exopolyphosphatase / guanosine-5'-triphosphate,3'-diphosphate pyrophosphatase
MTRVAAIDCGTNSIRLLVADIDGPNLTDVDRRLEIVRLGQDVDRTGRLAPEAIERTRVALAAYAEAISGHGADRVRMVATSATRDATNRDDFAAMVRETLGRDAEVISGSEEAALSFIGAVRGLPAGDPPYLVIDIGGGSTEFVLGRDEVEAARSVDVGSVRLTERHLTDDPPTPQQIAAAEADVRAAIETAAGDVPLASAHTVVGVAGSVTTIAAVALGLQGYTPERVHGAVLPSELVRHTADRLLAMTRAERAAVPAIHPGRIDVIGAGALVLRTVMTELGADRLVVSEHDILDGIARSLAPDQ